jgi:putative Ca2+/H+ antiporter (TMEM165/GDT1 family)
VPVGLGAFLALGAVSVLGAVPGPNLLKRIRLATIHRVGTGVCLLLSVMSRLQVVNVSIPALNPP